ncbi:hypothetical protein CsSME_00032898 [Camellia sinensis var. sinensis]
MLDTTILRQHHQKITHWPQFWKAGMAFCFRYQMYFVEYHNARLEAINAKERGDKKGQQQASQIIRKLKHEISALGEVEVVVV